MVEEVLVKIIKLREVGTDSRYTAQPAGGLAGHVC